MPRTIGAKDKKPRKTAVSKPKKIMLTKTEVDFAARLGVTPQQLAIEKSKLQNVNWEKLAKGLQTALRDEIDENQKRADDIEALFAKLRSLEHQIVGYQAVISYLESKRGHDTV